MTFVTLYGSNTDESEFYNNLHAKLNEHQVGELVLGGDFNFGFDRNLAGPGSSVGRALDSVW